MEARDTEKRGTARELFINGVAVPKKVRGAETVAIERIAVEVALVIGLTVRQAC